MVVAFLLNLCKFKHINFENIIQPSQIHYIGLRDVELKEFNILRNLGINYYISNDVSTYGIKTILDQIKNKVKDDDIHISFDVDALDPVIMPCTGTRAPNGLTLNDAIKIITYFDKNRFRTIDIVEFNPTINDERTNLDISLYTIDTMIKHC
jgi:arginase family enzyme